MSKSKQFDKQEVIAKATQLFWQKGFYATSMRNLQEVIDLRSGSIYATFGSKEGLFEACLTHYIDSNRTAFRAMIADSQTQKQPLIPLLKSNIKQGIKKSLANETDGICFLVKTISELTAEHQALLDLAKEYFLSFENEMARLISTAQANGEVDTAKDPAMIAKQIFIQQNGLRIYAKACDDKELLDGLVEGMFGGLG